MVRILAPAGTPQDIVVKLNSTIDAIVKSSDFQKQLAQLGADPINESPQFFSKFLQEEIARWQKVIKASGAKPG